MKKGKLGAHDYAVIMAGGSGTRLWPMSRKEKPKQFQSLLGEQSLLQTMYALLRKSFEPDRIFIQIPRHFVPFVKEQIAGISSDRILIEPEARDTGPAFAFAATSLIARDRKAVVGFYYSDHLIQSEKAFHKAVKEGFEVAEHFPDRLVLVGVRPLYPHIGLGYIRLGKKVAGSGVFEVSSFIEKPDIRRARHFSSSRKYLWNTGYKIGRASRILDLMSHASNAYKKNIPTLVLATARRDDRLIQKTFRSLPKGSFEYLVTEKTQRLLAIPSDMIWSDIGDWEAIHAAMGKKGKNAVHTIGRVAEYGSKGSFLMSNHRPVVGIGLTNIIVVETKHGVLVMSKKRSADFKKALAKLRAQDPESL